MVTAPIPDSAALAADASASTGTAGAGLVLIIVGALLTYLGVRAYRGSFRRWRGRTAYAGYLGPGLLYLGAALAILGLVLLFPGGEEVRKGPLGAIAAILFGLAFIVGVAGGLFAFVWMPRFLRPRWIRQVEGNDRDGVSPSAQLPAWTWAVRREAEAPHGQGDRNNDAVEPRVELSTSHGPRLERQALDYLDKISFHDRRAWARAGAACGQLIDAGLAEPDGAPTPAGLALTQPRRSGAPILRVTTDHDGEPMELSLFRSTGFFYAIWWETGAYRVDALAPPDVAGAVIEWLRSHRESTGWNFIRGTHELLGSFAVVDGAVHDVTAMPEGSAVRDGRVLDDGELFRRVSEMAATHG